MLHSELWTTLHDLHQGWHLDAGYPRIGHGLGDDVLPSTLDVAQLAEDVTLFEKGGSRLLVRPIELYRRTVRERRK